MMSCASGRWVRDLDATAALLDELLIGDAVWGRSCLGESGRLGLRVGACLKQRSDVLPAGGDVAVQ